jgi:hypothetical protein
MGEQNQLFTCNGLILSAKRKSRFRLASLESKKSAWKRAVPGSRLAG